MDLRQIMYLVQTNPKITQAFKMVQQNDVQGLEKMAREKAKEKGVPIEQLIDQVKGFNPR